MNANEAFASSSWLLGFFCFFSSLSCFLFVLFISLSCSFIRRRLLHPLFLFFWLPSCGLVQTAMIDGDGLALGGPGADSYQSSQPLLLTVGPSSSFAHVCPQIMRCCS
jgi:hypothetical protein